MTRWRQVIRQARADERGTLTLVEMMVALMLFSIVMGMVYTAFAVTSSTAANYISEQGAARTAQSQMQQVLVYLRQGQPLFGCYDPTNYEASRAAQALGQAYRVPQNGPTSVALWDPSQVTATQLSQLETILPANAHQCSNPQQFWPTIYSIAPTGKSNFTGGFCFFSYPNKSTNFQAPNADCIDVQDVKLNGVTISQLVLDVWAPTPTGQFSGDLPVSYTSCDPWYCYGQATNTVSFPTCKTSPTTATCLPLPTTKCAGQCQQTVLGTAARPSSCPAYQQSLSTGAGCQPFTYWDAKYTQQQDTTTKPAMTIKDPIAAVRVQLEMKTRNKGTSGHAPGDAACGGPFYCLSTTVAISNNSQTNNGIGGP